MGIKEEIAATGLDQAISANIWANKFRLYLHDRNLTDDENILKYLVLVQVNFIKTSSKNVFI